MSRSFLYTDMNQIVTKSAADMLEVCPQQVDPLLYTAGVRMLKQTRDPLRYFALRHLLNSVYTLNEARKIVRVPRPPAELQASIASLPRELEALSRAGAERDAANLAELKQQLAQSVPSRVPANFDANAFDLQEEDFSGGRKRKTRRNRKRKSRSSR